MFTRTQMTQLAVTAIMEHFSVATGGTETRALVVEFEEVLAGSWVVRNKSKSSDSVQCLELHSTNMTISDPDILVPNEP